ncbi:hypothetical protein LSAT2_012763 [Lamellibrachia satsuma]|nr:hypothetical protein LSAT2_012763 [Lamellibrachia satsuma]
MTLAGLMQSTRLERDVFNWQSIASEADEMRHAVFWEYILADYLKLPWEGHPGDRQRTTKQVKALFEQLQISIRERLQHVTVTNTEKDTCSYRSNH